MLERPWFLVQFYLLITTWANARIKDSLSSQIVPKNSLLVLVSLKSGKNQNGNVLISNLPANVYRTKASNTIIALTFPNPLLPSFQITVGKKNSRLEKSQCLQHYSLSCHPAAGRQPPPTSRRQCFQVSLHEEHAQLPFSLFPASNTRQL